MQCTFVRQSLVTHTICSRLTSIRLKCGFSIYSCQDIIPSPLYASFWFACLDDEEPAAQIHRVSGYCFQRGRTCGWPPIRSWGTRLYKFDAIVGWWPVLYYINTLKPSFVAPSHIISHHPSPHSMICVSLAVYVSELTSSGSCLLSLFQHLVPK